MSSRPQWASGKASGMPAMVPDAVGDARHDAIAPAVASDRPAGVTVLGNLAIDVINGAPRSPGGCASFSGVALEAAGGTRPHRRAGRRRGPRLVRSAARALRIARPDPAGRPHERVSPRLRRPRSPQDVGRCDRSGLGTPADRVRRPRYDLGAPRAAAADRLPRSHPGPSRRTRTSGGLRRAGPGPRRSARSAGRRSALPTGVAAEHRHPQARRGRGRHRRRRRLRRIGGSPTGRAGDSRARTDPRDATSTPTPTSVRVPAAWRVEDVQTTGAGDMFTSCYVANRAVGADPRRAAEAASQLVASELERRLRVGSTDPA